MVVSHLEPDARHTAPAEPETSARSGESRLVRGMRLWMERCDALYVLPSWKSSLGTVDGS